ncbi:replication initiation protein [Aliivibrio salmonicida]|uniref:replication initiation protein n=1 Tax=Aliivibrio salmonicida TaxID=40269 RepID=UPI00406BEB07
MSEANATATLQLTTTYSRKWAIAPVWYPDEALGLPDSNGVRDLIVREDRKIKSIPTLNRKLFNTVEKHGVWLNAQWPCLVYRLIEVGMRKRNLSFRVDHKQNLENAMRWISYHSDAVTGCINVTRLCIEIGKEIKVSSSTISVIMKELVVMGLLYEPEYSGQSVQDVLHGGHLPRTLCTTPLFYELLGINNDELNRLRGIEIQRRQIDAAKRQEQYDADFALKTFCQNNILRVWEHRHTQVTSSYKIKLSDMPSLERMSYISRKLVQRIKDKGWEVSLEKQNITKMANNLLSRMGLAVRQQVLPSPIPI